MMEDELGDGRATTAADLARLLSRMPRLLFVSACLTATGTRLGAGAVVASFALSRLLATAPIAPGGAGVSESGTAALLIALGA